MRDESFRRWTWTAAAAVLAVAAAPTLARAGAAEGKALYEKQCKTCHSIAGDAGKMANLGGPLDGFGTKQDAASMKAYFRDPKSKKPDSKMPPTKGTEQQLDDLVAYMLTLK